MTTILETRINHEGKPYEVLTPAALASDLVFDGWFVKQLREFLFRHGINVEHIPDATLSMQVRNTFANTKSRLGPITSANALQSEEQPTTPKEGKK